MVDGPSLTFVANVLGIPPPDVKNEPLLTAAYRVRLQSYCVLWQIFARDGKFLIDCFIFRVEKRYHGNQQYQSVEEA